MDTGAVVRFKPEVVTPLGFQDLMNILGPPEAKGRLDIAICDIKLYSWERWSRHT